MECGARVARVKPGLPLLNDFLACGVSLCGARLIPGGCREIPLKDLV